MINNLGRIYIPTEIVGNQTAKVAAVLSNIFFVPLRAEHLFYMDKFEMIGLSMMFKEIPTGSLAPEYQINWDLENIKDIIESIEVK